MNHRWPTQSTVTQSSQGKKMIKKTNLGHFPRKVIISPVQLITQQCLLFYFRESGSTLKWIHHRMPLFLANSEDVNLWLNPNISSFDAIDILHQRQNEDEVNLKECHHNCMVHRSRKITLMDDFHWSCYIHFNYRYPGTRCLLPLDPSKTKVVNWWRKLI